MPIYDFECQNPECEAKLVEIHAGINERVSCQLCGDEMKRLPSVFGNYKIKGDNSASVTPKRFRGEDK